MARWLLFYEGHKSNQPLKEKFIEAMYKERSGSSVSSVVVASRSKTFVRNLTGVTPQFCAKKQI
jgi:hypothetical protein